MLIAGSHPQIFMTEELGDGMNVRALHPQPRGRGVSQVVQAHVCNTDLAARAQESERDVFRADVLTRWEYTICRRRAVPWNGIENLASEFIQPDGCPSPFFVCGSRMRLPARSTSSQRKPSSSDRRIPVQTSRATIGRSHRGQASSTARSWSAAGSGRVRQERAAVSLVRRD